MLYALTFHSALYVADEFEGPSFFGLDCMAKTPKDLFSVAKGTWPSYFSHFQCNVIDASLVQISEEALHSGWALVQQNIN